MRARGQVRGPFFEELTHGEVFADAPAVTLTTGMSAAHQAIVGSRLRLALDERLSQDVAGQGLASPGLVWDLAIGQSTSATQNVRANLFYRGLVFRRFPRIGDTLTTTTTVMGLRQNRRREGRQPTGLAALRITTTDQHGNEVLDFLRCAMIPLGDPRRDTGAADDLDVIGQPADDHALAAAVGGWQFERAPGRSDVDLTPGVTWQVAGGDVVSSAPELARLTMNLAAVHHDARAAGGTRLVYGGHSIGIACTQMVRALPDILTVVGWHACDHVGPVYEGDTLRSVVVVERLQPLESGSGRLVHLRVQTTADGQAGAPDRQVLDWRPVVVIA